ncbi:MAG: glycosyltransferase [Gaiellaceae bacterium]
MTRRRLRVLFLVDYAVAVGGAERVALGLATHLPQDRFEVSLFSTRRTDQDAISACEAAGVRHVNLGKRRTWHLGSLRHLARLIRTGHFDILHAHKFGSNLWGTVLGRLFGVPVIIAHEHTWSYEGDPVRVWLDGHVIGRLVTRFVAVSSADASRMVTLEGVPRDKVIVVPNAWLPHATSGETDIRRELGLAARTPVVGVVAALRPQKVLEVLIAAHARVLETHPDVHLIIAGEGPTRPALDATVREHGIGAHVHFLGRRRDIDALLRDVDVAALSSDFEGTPLFALEAMAAGTPMVSTSVGGLPDLIEDGRTGLLVARRDPDGLAAAISRLVGDPALRARMGAAAAERAKSFTMSAITEELASLYETLAAEAGL